MSSIEALPAAAFFLFFEAAAGGVVALFLVYLRGEAGRGFALFTGWCLLVAAALAEWLRATFPPALTPVVDARGAFWFGAERTTSIVFIVALAVYLIALQARRERRLRPIAPLVPLCGLVALWCAALVQTSPQLGGLGAPLATLAGATALGSALVGLSLGHWYLVTPTLSTRPLIRLTLLCLGSIGVQVVLEVLLLALPGGVSPGIARLFSNDALFLAARVVFGLAVPAGAAAMAWRTARIRSLDSATGLLYIVAALVLAGEIVARTLFFVTGVAV